MISFSQYELGEICSRLSSGKGISAREISERGKYPVYGGNGLRGYTSSSNFKGECVIIGRQGAFCGNVRFFSGEAYMTEHAVVLSTNNNNDARYVFYVLSKMNLGALSGQSAQPGLSVKMLNKILIRLPDLQYQKKVVKIIKAIEDKIELNTQINQNLEQQAQAIFKSWFVDFEPFQDGKFVDYELGPIPDGWRVVSLEDIALYNNEKLSASQVKLSTYVSTENMLPNRGGIELASSVPSTGCVTVFAKNDVLLSNIRPYFRKIWYASLSGTCSTDVLCFRAKAKVESEYLFCVLNNEKFFEYIMSGAKGTKMPRGDKRQMMSYRIVMPPQDIRENFAETLKPLVEHQRRNTMESRRLATLRDTLLPKLMSGEIDVSEVAV